MYDILFGANHSYTPLQYDINYKNYLYISEGTVKIRFTPPINEKHLDIFIDYETMDITSRINVWKETNIENVKFIDIVVEKGNMIYIPPYWLYSIQFIETSTIISFKYKKSCYHPVYYFIVHIVSYKMVGVLTCRISQVKSVLDPFEKTLLIKL